MNQQECWQIHTIQWQLQLDQQQQAHYQKKSHDFKFQQKNQTDQADAAENNNTKYIPNSNKYSKDSGILIQLSYVSPRKDFMGVWLNRFHPFSFSMLYLIANI
jgi:hypothetical protein